MGAAHWHSACFQWELRKPHAPLLPNGAERRMSQMLTAPKQPEDTQQGGSSRSPFERDFLAAVTVLN